MKGDKMYWYVYKCKHSGKDGRGHKKGDKMGCGMPQIRKVKNIDLGLLAYDGETVSILGSPRSNCGKKSRFDIGCIEYCNNSSMFRVTRRDFAYSRKMVLHKQWRIEEKRKAEMLKRNPQGYAQMYNETPKKIEEIIRSEDKSEKKEEGGSIDKSVESIGASLSKIADRMEAGEMPSFLLPKTFEHSGTEVIE